ncbi:DUF3592 domain-containing protein [Calidithermus terrae]|nr:DUF3592 domain-containing protein [Calidithermus terrae]
MKPAFFRGYWWLWVVCTALLALISLADLAFFLRARSWAVTTGAVLEEEYVRRGGRNNFYLVRYRFEAGGREYVDAFKDGHNLEPARLGGGRVTVYYDPRDPRRSTLDRRLNPRGIRYLPVALAVGVWLYWTERRPLRGKAERP